MQKPNTKYQINHLINVKKTNSKRKVYINALKNQKNEGWICYRLKDLTEFCPDGALYRLTKPPYYVLDLS